MRLMVTAIFRRTLPAVAVLALVAISGSDARAQGSTYQHLDELAAQMERFGRRIREEVHHHLQANVDYRRMDRAAHRIEDLAAHLHQVAHQRGSVSHLQQDIENLDRWVHYADELAHHMSRQGVLTRHWQGFQALRGLIRSMLSVLHHMQRDLHDLNPSYRVPDAGVGNGSPPNPLASGRHRSDRPSHDSRGHGDPHGNHPPLAHRNLDGRGSSHGQHRGHGRQGRASNHWNGFPHHDHHGHRSHPSRSNRAFPNVYPH